MLCVNHKKFKTLITRGKTQKILSMSMFKKSCGKLRNLLNIYNSSVIPSKNAAEKAAESLCACPLIRVPRRGVVGMFDSGNWLLAHRDGSCTSCIYTSLVGVGTRIVLSITVLVVVLVYGVGLVWWRVCLRIPVCPRTSYEWGFIKGRTMVALVQVLFVGVFIITGFFDCSITG